MGKCYTSMPPFPTEQVVKHLPAHPGFEGCRRGLRGVWIDKTETVKTAVLQAECATDPKAIVLRLREEICHGEPGGQDKPSRLDSMHCTPRQNNKAPFLDNTAKEELCETEKHIWKNNCSANQSSGIWKI